MHVSDDAAAELQLGGYDPASVDGPMHMTANIAREGNFAVKAFSVKCVTLAATHSFHAILTQFSHNFPTATLHLSPLHLPLTSPPSPQICRQGAAALLAANA